MTSLTLKHKRQGYFQGFAYNGTDTTGTVTWCVDQKDALRFASHEDLFFLVGGIPGLRDEPIANFEIWPVPY
jgi:hypothetical protein